MNLSSSSKKLIIRISLFLLYLLLGAAIFMLIEASNESEERAKAKKFKDLRKNFLNGSKTSEDVTNFLLKLEHALRYGYDINKDGLNGAKWSFMNSFYFVGNIVTTIGYGHMVPETDGGRIFCIIYALFGIPLTALMLRSVGNRITESIISILRLFDRRVFNREIENAEIKSAVIAFGLLWLIILIPAIVYCHVEVQWDYLEAVYYCFITFSTIGFGDLVPNALRGDQVSASHVFVEFADLLYLVIGLAIMSSVVVAISGVIESKTQMLVDPMEAFRRIDMENLNSVAVKKLGLKMNGTDARATSNAQMRRLSEVPNGHINRRNSRFPNWEEGRPQERKSTDRIEHVGPAPVISIAARQPNTSRNSEGNSSSSPPRKLEQLAVPIDPNSSLVSPSNSPQPPPVFKSNKVIPVEKEDNQGQVNIYCETMDETAIFVEEELCKNISGDEGADREEDTDESSVTGFYELQEERDNVINLQSEEILKFQKLTAREQGI